MQTSRENNPLTSWKRHRNSIVLRSGVVLQNSGIEEMGLVIQEKNFFVMFAHNKPLYVICKLIDKPLAAPLYL